MQKKVLMLAGLIAAALEGSAYAVSPELVGNYAGSGKFKIYNTATNDVITTKIGLLLNIANNDTFTIFDSNGGQNTGSGNFSANHAVLRDFSGLPTNGIMLLVHFKKAGAKGTLMIDSPPGGAEGKFSLKKI